MKLTLGFSPCPNDTFIFDALVHNKIDTEGLEFDFQFDDVETLNQKALCQELDITKLSYHAYAHLVDKYVILNSGSALGFGVGPLLISKNDVLSSVTDKENPLSVVNSLSDYIGNKKIGIPGKLTTANFLLSIAFPNATNKFEMVFSEIESELIKGNIDFGLIIHENRFTYQDKGLFKVVDLGEYWEKLTGKAIPLGGICIKRDLPIDVKAKVDRLIKKSVEYAFANPSEALSFIKNNAQEMQEDVMMKHIKTYVNNFSIDLGEIGRSSIITMFDIASEKKIISKVGSDIFI